ncbi:putative pectinesterase A [Penicillium rolfsii]|nr:putative pectinesterase A [Penicillium rolfsii]
MRSSIPHFISLLWFFALSSGQPLSDSSDTLGKSQPHAWRQICQASTPRNPLHGCPKGTLLVSQSHKQAKFSTIQGAIDSLPHDDSSQTILILAGNYTEQLNITRPGPLTLLGQTDHPTDAAQNRVNVLWAAATSQGIYTDNVFTSVMVVAPTLNASLTGSGASGLPVPEDTPFGCRDFRTYNMDFRNVYADQSAGPSHALSFSRANGGFYYSGFYSYQDTVFIGKLGNAYFYSSVIAGQTDFLYGFGTGWFEECDLVLRGCGGGITAWKGTNTTYTNKFGAYIHNSTIKAANSSVEAVNKGKCALGRPWNSAHRSIFANTYEDTSIAASGYVLWSSPITNQTLMAEYKDFGPGFNITGRLQYNYTILLDDKGWEPYSSPRKVFLTPSGETGQTSWIDSTYIMA